MISSPRRIPAYATELSNTNPEEYISTAILSSSMVLFPLCSFVRRLSKTIDLFLYLSSLIIGYLIISKAKSLIRTI